MPTFVFTAPDGREIEVTGPEGATVEQAFEIAKGQYAKLPRDDAKQDFYQRVGINQQPQETSFLEGVWQGLEKPWSNAARVLETGAEKIGIAEPLNRLGETLGLDPSVAAAEKVWDEAAAKRNLRPSAAGRMVGEMAGTAVAAAATKNPWAIGAIGGALTTDARDPIGVLQDAATGAVIGKVADTAVEGAARVISPKVRAGVQKLLGEGVELTPGQIIGGAAKRVEEKAASLPIVGDFIRKAHGRGVVSFNRAATNRALAPIGEKLPDDVAPGHEAVKWAGDKLSQAYNDLLPKMSAPFDQTLATRLNVVRQTADLAPPQAQRLEKIIQEDVRRAFDPKTGVASGRRLRDLDEKLRLHIQNFATGGPEDRYLADAIAQVREHVQGLVRRANPQYAQRLREINKGWAHLVRLEAAAKNTPDGVFTPKQFNQAVRQSTGGVRKRAAARGEALMQDLAKEGAANLSPEIPNSGTVDRGLQAGLIGAGTAVRPDLLALAGGASLPYTPLGQRAATWALTGRQGPVARSLADLVRMGRTPAAMAAPVLLRAPQEQ